MIYLIAEGHPCRIGLNITTGRWRKPYIKFRWLWYDTVTRQLSSRFFRIRFYQWPAFIWGRGKADVVDSWLLDHDMIAVQRELLEDEAPRLLAVMQVLKENGYPEPGKEIVLTST